MTPIEKEVFAWLTINEHSLCNLSLFSILVSSAGFGSDCTSSCSLLTF